MKNCGTVQLAKGSAPRRLLAFWDCVRTLCASDREEDANGVSDRPRSHGEHGRIQPGASGQRAFVRGHVVAIEPDGITVDLYGAVGDVSRTKVTEDRLVEPLAPD